MAPILDFHQVISALTTLLMTLTLTLSPVKTSLYNISTQQGWKNFKWKKVWPRTGRGKEFLPFFSFFIFPYPHTLAFLMNPFLNLLLPDHTIARSFITLTYKSADEILRCSFQIKPHGQNFHIVLFTLQDFNKTKIWFCLWFYSLANVSNKRVTGELSHIPFHKG